MAKIDKATIEVSADIDDLKASMTEAHAEVEAVGDAGEVAGEKIESSMERAGTKIEGSTVGVRKLVGAVSSVVGVFTAVVGVIALVTSGIKKAREEQKAFDDLVKSTKQSYDDQLSSALFARSNSSELSRELRDNQIAEKKAIEEITEAHEKELKTRQTEYKKTFDFIRPLFGVQTIGQLEDAHAEAVKNIQKTSSEIATVIRRDAADAAAAVREEYEKVEMAKFNTFKDQIKQLNESYRISLLPEEDQIRANAEIQRQALVDAAAEANLHVSNDALQLALWNITEEEREKIRSNREIAAKDAADRIAKEADVAKKQAAAIATALERELSGVAASLFGSTGGVTTMLNTIVKDLRAVSDAIRSSK